MPKLNNSQYVQDCIYKVKTSKADQLWTKQNVRFRWGFFVI